jgi:hypothetical protein
MLLLSFFETSSDVVFSSPTCHLKVLSLNIGLESTVASCFALFLSFFNKTEFPGVSSPSYSGVAGLNLV